MKDSRPFAKLKEVLANPQADTKAPHLISHDRTKRPQPDLWTVDNLKKTLVRTRV